MSKYNLLQEKLDVIVKKRSNSFDWRGQFTPELIEYLLSVFGKDGCVVADPFSGSGTVLFEAIRCGYDAIGFEINPSAFYMSKFYEYCSINKQQREEIIEEIRKMFGVIIRDMDSTKMVYVKSDDYRKAYADLLAFSKYCNSITPTHLLPFIINVLFLCEKDKKLTLRDSLIKNINFLKRLLVGLPESDRIINANWADARKIGSLYKDKVDLIITSPPYINVFNYHQNYRGIVECFDYNLLQVANSEIGSNRKNRQNRFRTVIQYAIDMGHVLISCSESLRNGGKMIWVVGRCSNVRKVPFYNSAIITDLVKSIPGLEMDDVCLRKFGNRYGEDIIEDILIIQKTNEIECANLTEVFEGIGIEHLQKSLPLVAEADKPDIDILVNKYNKVFESPILQY